MSVLEEILIEELTGKKILLVLDDCDKESPELWNDLWKLFNVCSKGSAIIITTKSKEVANLFGAMQTCHLNSLSKEDCFMIFQEHVLGGLGKNDYPPLESVGWKAVEKCGGNALCMKALSGLLCHSEIGLSEMDMLVDGILPALRLCYDLLPSHLQQCFKFCSLFPKGYNFTRHQIVRLWIAHGFVFPEEGSQLEEAGQHYFDELFCRSFFQHSPYHNDDKQKFVLHELFHDLAHSVSENECFRSEEPFCSFPENISHLSLVPSYYKTVVLTKGIRNLHSLLVVRRFFPAIRILHLDEVYVKYIYLRALNLSGTDILQLPSSIQNMEHLRFLALSNTKIKGLPSEIGQVDTLQTLELKDCCQLTDLPESISKLVKLRHLDIQKEPGNIKVSLPHGIGQLTDLQTLTEFNIGNNLSQCSIVEFRNLNGLRGHVHVTGLENIKTADDAREANIVSKHFLESLTLEWFYSDGGMNDDLGKEIANEILQNLQTHSNLQKLVIRNYGGNLFPLWMQEPYLIKLVSITLDNCYGCSELPYLGNLPSLKSLFIQRINSVESFGIGSNSLATAEKHPPRFPSLEVLTLWEMYDLEFWIGTSDGDFPRIRHLSISKCPKLINLPPLPSLVHLTVDCGGQVPSFSELPSLESLKIKGFHQIRAITFPHHLKMLKKLEISDCKELSSLFAYSLSVSDLKVVRCLKLDLVGSSLDQHHGQRVVVGRYINSLSFTTFKYIIILISIL
jgi:Leucine-rich repeat (LRR) protein